jgi:hypothetical protein
MILEKFAKKISRVTRLWDATYFLILNYLAKKYVLNFCKIKRHVQGKNKYLVILKIKNSIVFKI